jgi:hypothetical protein
MRRMNMAEIRERYQGEWVLIRFGSLADLDENLAVIEGEVVAHAPTREEVERAEEQAGPGNYAVEFMGEISPEDAALGEDIGFML